MKLQNLIIIFLAIALPVIIILSVYVEMQVKTSALREQYTDALINSAHEAMVAFQINTTNDAYSNVTDVKIRDIQGAFNVFASALSTNFGATGSVKGYSMTYVPVAAFTLYDGYYIYMPTESRWDVTENRKKDEKNDVNDNDKYTIEYSNEHWKKINMTHEMKAYVHYVKEYNKGKEKLIVNFTLDNFVTAYYFNRKYL